MRIFMLLTILSLLLISPSFVEAKGFNTIFKGNVSAYLAEDACNVYEKSSVSLFSVNPGISKCSGVIIKEHNNRTYVLTAKHCINLNEEVYVEDYEVINIITSVFDDLAILVIEGNIKNKKPAKLSNDNLPKNEMVYFIGYPSLIDTYKSVGKAIKYSKDWGYAHLKSVGGCSGAGIYKKGGYLIGILWGGLRNKDVTIFETLEDIKRFLKSIELL